MTATTKDVLTDSPIPTGDEWIADEISLKVGGKQYWIFSVMDADSRAVLAAYLSRERTARAAATALSMARERADRPPNRIKTDGLRSYRQGVKTTFLLWEVKDVVSQGIRAKITTTSPSVFKGHPETATRRYGA